MIESNSNKNIKRIEKLLTNARFRRKEQAFIVEGKKMIREALEKKLVREIYIDEEKEEDIRREFSSLFENVKIEIIKKSIFNSISDMVSPQGVLAIIDMPFYEKEEILKKDSVRIITLENIQDPGNMGTIIRTAEGAGMDAVAMTKGCVDVFNPKVVRSTMGAMFRMPLLFFEDSKELMNILNDNNIKSICAHLKGDKNYRADIYREKISIWIGNESKGLSDYVYENADQLVKIPMKGKLESLNAAVAAALLMYESDR